MRRLARALAIAAACLLAAALLASAYVYLASERFLRRTYDAPLVELRIPTDSASIAEGERLANIRGCHGCHGSDHEGKVFRDGFLEGRQVAPNLSRVAREYTPAQLARVIRHGVRANGESVQAMPSDMFFHLSDADLGKIIAFLRSKPLTAGPAYEFAPGPEVRWEIVTGERAAVADLVRDLGPRAEPPEPDDTLAVGEYLAKSSCSECHGQDFTGDWGPDLVLSTTYSAEEFLRFLRSGRARSGRELPVMSRIARGRFSHFTDGEIRAVYGFLQSRASARP